MRKNTACVVEVDVYDATTGEPKTGLSTSDLTLYVNIDDAGLTAIADTSSAELHATNAPGTYLFSLSASETNGYKIVVTGKSATANVFVIRQTFYTQVALLSTGLDAVLIESGITASSALLNDSEVQLTSINARQAIALMQSALAGLLTGAASSEVTINAAGGVAHRIVATVDSNGNRTGAILTVPD